MNSKGNLLTGEVLKMVLAVICIGLLIYLLSALYFSKINSQKMIEAQSSLDRISEGIFNMEQNSLTEFEAYDLSPNGWTVFGFVDPEKKPNFCSGESCLCICKKATRILGSSIEKQLERCDKDGVCELIEELKDFPEFKLNSSEGGFTGVEIKLVSGSLEVEAI